MGGGVNFTFSRGMKYGVEWNKELKPNLKRNISFPRHVQREEVSLSSAFPPRDRVPAKMSSPLQPVTRRPFRPPPPEQVASKAGHFESECKPVIPPPPAPHIQARSRTASSNLSSISFNLHFFFYHSPNLLLGFRRHEIPRRKCASRNKACDD